MKYPYIFTYIYMNILSYKTKTSSTINIYIFLQYKKLKWNNEVNKTLIFLMHKSYSYCNYWLQKQNVVEEELLKIWAEFWHRKDNIKNIANTEGVKMPLGKSKMFVFFEIRPQIKKFQEIRKNYWSRALQHDFR